VQALQQYLKQHEARFVQELCEYVRFPSVSAQPEHKSDLLACAEWVREQCQRIGLEAQLCPTSGHPIVWARTPRSRSATRPHFLVYGHYDVQPADPLELWSSPPFEPRVKNDLLRGRGASDNKGQHWAHLKAVEAWLATGTPLPCDLTFLIEGEEEVGSRSLVEFVKAHAAELKCDAIVISDNGIPSLKHPALTYALRGVAAIELEVHGPSSDLHSGIFGGCVDNPAMVLAQMLAQLRDRHGRITVPGFYDDVVPLTARERKQLARLPYRDAALRRLLGVRALFGERGYTSTEQRTARPTLEINGLTSGYQGPGSKTIIPAWARAKITCRLVPNQRPGTIQRLLVRHLRRLCPPTVRLKITGGHGAEPYLVSPDSPLAQAALRALRTAFKRQPVLMREGGSIPIVTELKKILHADSLLLGLALPDDNAHAPNEKFDLKCFRFGLQLGMHLWPELARAVQASPGGLRRSKRNA